MMGGVYPVPRMTVFDLGARESLTFRCDACGRETVNSRARLLELVGDAELDTVGLRPELACRCGAQPSRGWVTWEWRQPRCA
jgi:hypothetical protein